MDSEGAYNLSEDELALITGYLNGELAAEDRLEFDQRLAVEPVLQKKLEEVRGLLVGVREANLALQLNTYHAELNPKGKSPVYGRRLLPYRNWWIAASAVFVMGIGIWWIWFSTPSNERLYRHYFIPDMGLPVEMASTDSLRYSFYDGMISYKEGKYHDALEKWAPVAGMIGNTDTLLYYRGVAGMAVGNIGYAIEQLFPVASERRSVFYEEATWYLALCYLNQEEPSKAVALLKRIPQHAQAPALLKKLE